MWSYCKATYITKQFQVSEGSIGIRSKIIFNMEAYNTVLIHSRTLHAHCMLGTVDATHLH